MEDNLAYQISYSKHSRAAPSLEIEQREPDDDRLKRLYLKTAGDSEPDENLTELESLLTALIVAYVSGFRIDGRIPYQLREVFENDMSRFSKNLSEDISKKYQSALNSGSLPEEAMEQSQAVIKEGMSTLAAKLSRYDKDFEALVALLHYKDEGYNVRKRTLYCANAAQVGTRRILQYYIITPRCGYDIIYSFFSVSRAKKFANTVSLIMAGYIAYTSFTARA